MFKALKKLMGLITDDDTQKFSSLTTLHMQKHKELNDKFMKQQKHAKAVRDYNNPNVTEERLKEIIRDYPDVVFGE